MKEIEIFDPKEEITYKLNVEDDVYEEIVSQGNFALAMSLLQKQREKNNFMAAYKVWHSDSTLTSSSKNLNNGDLQETSVGNTNFDNDPETELTTTDQNTDSLAEQNSSDTNSEAGCKFNSNFMTKRKRTENTMERRHREKMARQDRYLDLLERLTTAIEKNTQESEDRTTNN